MKTGSEIFRKIAPFQFLLGLLLIVLIPVQVIGQSKDTLTLSQAFQKVHEHFEFQKNKQHYQRIGQIRSDQVDINYYPEFTLNAQGNYQSEVVSLPFEIPMQDPLNLPHIRAQLNAQITQQIYDGGISKAQKQLEILSSTIDGQQLKIKEEQVEQQLTQLYFQILLLQNVQESLRTSMQLLHEKKVALEAAVERGVAMESDLLQLEAELIKIGQDTAQYHHQIEALILSLGKLMGRKLADISLRLPDVSVDLQDSMIQDPKIELLKLQKHRLEESTALSKAQNNPKAKAFARGGVGYPNPFNFFDDNWSPFFTAGIQASWPIYDWGRHEKEKELIQVRSQILNSEIRQQKIQISTGLQKQIGQFKYLKKALEQDLQLLEKRTKIRQLASLRLDQGLITTNEYLEAVNEEQLADLQYKRHQVELAKAKVQYVLESGKSIKN